MEKKGGLRYLFFLKICYQGQEYLKLSSLLKMVILEYFWLFGKVKKYHMPFFFSLLLLNVYFYIWKNCSPWATLSI